MPDVHGCCGYGFTTANSVAAMGAALPWLVLCVVEFLVGVWIDG